MKHRQQSILRLFPCLITSLGAALAVAGTYQTNAHNSFAELNDVDSLSVKNYGCNLSPTVFDSYAKVDSTNVADALFRGGPGVEVVFVPSSPNEAPANGVQLNFSILYATDGISGAIAQILNSDSSVLYGNNTGGSFVTIGSATAFADDLWVKEPNGTYTLEVYWEALGVRANNLPLSSAWSKATVRYTLTSITPIP